MSPPRLSVVIPTMNEEESIGHVLEEVSAALTGWDGGYEILVVDTESKDRTVEIAQARGARVIEEPRRGYGRAYRTGFGEARGELVATLDADMTYPATRIPDLAALIDEGADFVTGDRLSGLGGGAMRGMHRIGNEVLSITARVLFRVPLADSQSGMWVFRRDILPSLDVTSDGMAYSEEIKIEAHRKGFRLKEVPVEYRARVGEAKIRSVTDAWKNFVFLFKKRFGWTGRPA